MLRQQEHMTEAITNLLNLFKTSNFSHLTELEKIDTRIQKTENQIMNLSKESLPVKKQNSFNNNNTLTLNNEVQNNDNKNEKRRQLCILI